MSQAGIISTTSGPVPPTVPTQFTADDGNVAIPAANNLNVFGDTGIETFVPVPGGDTLNIRVVTDSFTWSEEVTDFNAQIQHGYYCNASLTATLPVTAGLVTGNTVIIYNDTNSLVAIQTSPGQQIQVGDEVSSVGGGIGSNIEGGLIELNFKVSDSTWHTISSIGTWITS